MPNMSAIVGTGRVNGFRLGYLPTALSSVRPTHVQIRLGGVLVNPRISGLTIQNVINNEPDRCSLTLDGTPPSGGEDLRITYNSDAPVLLFNGALQSVDVSYAGKPDQVFSRCRAIDDSARLNERRPFGTWTSVSATSIAQEIIASFAPGFTTHHVESGLPAVSITFDGSDEFSSCLARLAKLVGGYWYVEDLDLHLFTAEATDTPDPIQLGYAFCDDPPLTADIDRSQIRTRVYGKGHGEAVLSDVLAGETIIPIADAVLFGTISAGGLAIAGTTPDGAQSQLLTYGGVRQGGAGSLVGPGASPSVAPVVGLVVGSGLATGLYGYGYSLVTAAGESLPSPIGLISVGIVNPPVAALIPNTPTGGAGADAGDHDYKVTFVAASGGETTPGPTSVQVTTTSVTPPVAPVFVGGSGSGGGPFSPGDYFWACTYITSSGETSAGSSLLYGGALGLNFIDITIPVGPSGVTSRKIYRTTGGGSQLKLLATVSNNTTTAYRDTTADGGLGVNVPTTNTAGRQAIYLSFIPTGDGSVVSRRLYRRFNASGDYKLVTTIADNVTLSYNDTTANASLGAVAPLTNTATGANQVSVSSVAVGPASVTARKIYRTVVGGSQLKLQQTIADNTTTTGVTDATADGSLGANAPVTDTSGLTQPAGQVLAGATTVPTASPAPFPSSGWVTLGGQVIRYSGVSGNSLTGVPASGPGALLTTVTYGSPIVPAPCLTDVTGLALSMQKGATVHVWVQRDDGAAQAALIALDAAQGRVSDGIREHTITDERRGEASLIALCDADLALFSTPIITVTYATRDTKTKSGKTIVVNLASPPISATLTIQDVTISEVGVAPRLGPKFTVTASSVRFSLEDLLRRMSASLESE